jgi:hypothetical protein
MKKLFTLAMAITLLIVAPAIADQVTLDWSDNTEPDLAGYKIYYKAKGAADFDRDNPVYDGTASQAVVTVPGDGEFVATAYDDVPNESVDSDPALYDVRPDQVQDLRIMGSTR